MNIILVLLILLVIGGITYSWMTKSGQKSKNKPKQQQEQQEQPHNIYDNNVYKIITNQQEQQKIMQEIQNLNPFIFNLLQPIRKNKQIILHSDLQTLINDYNNQICQNDNHKSLNLAQVVGVEFMLLSFNNELKHALWYGLWYSYSSGIPSRTNNIITINNLFQGKFFINGDQNLAVAPWNEQNKNVLLSIVLNKHIYIQYDDYTKCFLEFKVDCPEEIKNTLFLKTNDKSSPVVSYTKLTTQ